MTMTENAVDPQALTHVLGDDRAMKLNILEKFVVQVEEVISGIETAQQADDADQVGFLGHKLKSSARTVGANSLADLCFELECAGKEGDLDTIKAISGSMRGIAAQVSQYVEDFKAG